jgi:hypothetical protein
MRRFEGRPTKIERLYGGGSDKLLYVQLCHTRAHRFKVRRVTFTLGGSDGMAQIPLSKSQPLCGTLTRMSIHLGRKISTSYCRLVRKEYSGGSLRPRQPSEWKNSVGKLKLKCKYPSATREEMGLLLRLLIGSVLLGCWYLSGCQNEALE